MGDPNPYVAPAAPDAGGRAPPWPVPSARLAAYAVAVGALGALIVGAVFALRVGAVFARFDTP